MKSYRTLDACVVIGSMIQIAAVLDALVFVKIPPPQLPIIAGLAGTIFGATVGAYGGARWANRKTDEPTKPGDVSVSLTATAAAEPKDETT